MRSLFALLAVLAAVPALAQDAPIRLSPQTLAAWQAQDHPLEWRGYDGGTSRGTARLYRNDAADRGDRPLTVVVQGHPDNRAPITADALFLAETVGRALGVDPVRIAFLFRFDLDGRRSPLTLRATVRRGDSGRLSGPSWRVLTPDGVEDYTDRALR